MKKQLESCNIRVSLINIEKDKISPNDYDRIIIGGPVYIERYPEILLEYIERYLKDYKGKCMLFSSQANTDKNSVFQHALMRLKFLNITYCEYITMPNNFFNFGFKRLSSEEEIKIIRASVDKSIKAVNEFLNNKEKYYPFKKSKVVAYNLVYKIFYTFFTHFMVKDVEVDFDKCVHCRICERNCPMKAITVSKDKVKINRHCLLCQRCMSSCPKSAFKYKAKEFIQYNPDFKDIMNSAGNDD